MNEISCQWLTADPSLFELSWLQNVVFKNLNCSIKVTENLDLLEVKNNTLLVCNHAVPYRNFLEKLRKNGCSYGIVLLSDENLREPNEWLHDPACKLLVRNYVHPNQLNHPKVMTIGLGYKRDFVKYLKNNKKAKNRELTWSFAGTLHGDRQLGVNLFKKLTSCKVHTCSGFGAADGLATQEYAETLENSLFALCPPGQDSNDSFRTYEALEAGCIPVTLANSTQFVVHPSYWHAVFRGSEIPFIVGENYEDCLNQTKQVIKEGRTQQMQENCMKFWTYWKQKWANDVAQKIQTKF